AVLFGSLFAWTLVQDAKFLLFWAALYAALFLKPFVIERHEDDVPWSRWGLVGLTVCAAAFLLGFGWLR
ncbi:MAG TPA: hypothetical protein VL283_02025, partial [Candidatus Baltobacteraceae bacterium]|nr:hypothetical protein [Candidatus Baltobacteraceae bacterium]